MIVHDISIILSTFSTYKYTQSDEYKLQPAFNKAVVTDVDNQRPLTENEINFLYNFGFKDSIDYDSVRVYASPESDAFFSSTGIGGVADNNKVAVSTHSYSDDSFANNASEMGKLLFLHEMTHIWQLFLKLRIFNLFRSLNATAMRRRSELHTIRPKMSIAWIMWTGTPPT